MNNPKLRKILSVSLILVFLAGGAISQRQLNRGRAELGLTRITPLENAPPVLAFTTVALGGFRGLIANILWVRAVDLQDAGKFFEMVQLADWITKLQPHFASVWVNQAWNMSYNISVKFQDHRDRWQWVRRGIELLRDEGLRYNPRETLIYRELAWQFQHKMGQSLDDAHFYYKQSWAAEMTNVFGGTKPNFDELIKPTTPESEKRAKLLREKYKMDPALMQEVDKHYGPLEWRLPESHAIYWAWVGLKYGKKEDQITLRRVIFQSMDLACMRGRIVENKYGVFFDYAPNLEITRNANKAYEEMMEQDPENRQAIVSGHRNFLLRTVYFLYTYNRIAEANEWYDYCAKVYPDKGVIPGDPESLPSRVPMEDFALSRLGEDANETSDTRVRSLLRGLVANSFFNLAAGVEDRAFNYNRLAEKVWQRYMKKIAGAEKRVGLPPLKAISLEVLDQLLGPDSKFDDELKARLRTELRLGTNSPVQLSTNAPVSIGPTDAPPKTDATPAKRIE